MPEISSQVHAKQHQVRPQFGFYQASQTFFHAKAPSSPSPIFRPKWRNTGAFGAGSSVSPVFGFLGELGALA
jgi:hypothetical protein